MSGNHRLSEHYRRFIEDQLATGKYATETEVVQTGLRLLEERERRETEKVEEIRRTIAADRLRGKFSSADDVFDRVETRIREKLSPS